jgi:tetratricopeptide (TPR) repeat protein
VGALESAWDHLTARDASEFDPPRQAVLAWARRGAAQCEARGFWAGAVRHLSVLLEESAEPALYARRGKARAEIAQYAGALADYDRALEKGAGRWEWWAGRGDAAAALGRWEQARDDFTRATQMQQRRPELWRRLGEIQAERGQWKQSADALARAVRFGAADPVVLYEQALAQLSTGDVKGYRRTCERLVKKFGERDEAAVRRVVADACTFGPEPVADFKPLLDRAELVVRGAPGDMEEHARLAGLLLRAGRPDPAAVLLEKCAADGRAGRPEQWLLVLAYQQSAQPERAKEWLAWAMKQKPRAGAPWSERQKSILWQKEAEAKKKGGDK